MKKVKVQIIEGVDPGLFGQKHSSRDYRYEDAWGKNQFNSSFPASLVAYMSDKGIAPVYICTDSKNNIVHKNISGEKLLGINPLSDNAYYDYEAGIVNTLAYRYKTDKAFAISGRLTNPFMKCKELVCPRVSKFEIKNIILGDGQKLLRPERRFDAYLVSHPELFVK